MTTTHQHADRPAPTCPLCGEPMRSRTSVHGRFWGCSQYPGCRGTRPGDYRAGDDQMAESFAERDAKREEPFE